MMVIARDAVAADQLVYAWPLSIGPECEVVCGEQELVVMCPAWMVGDRLGPGHHLWRTPDPTRPVSAFFVLTTAVDCTFDMTTSFMMPATGQPVRLRATGAVQVRCGDPGLLIAQFVGLPFDHVNDSILRSVSRSIERMLARLLTRRVVMAGAPAAVTDPAMLPSILEELVAYNPTAGAVFGIELLQFTELVIGADDGAAPFVVLPNRDFSGQVPVNGEHRTSEAEISLVETARGRPKPETLPMPSGSGELKKTLRHGSIPPIAEASGEIIAKPIATPPPGTIEAHTTEEATQPGVRTPTPGSLRAPEPAPAAAAEPAEARPPDAKPDGARPDGAGADGAEPDGAKADGSKPDHAEPQAAILGIGMAPIGSSSSSSSASSATSVVVSGEIKPKVSPGKRVLVPGPDGLMQSATVRQLLRGYYELEVGSSGETIWVPANNVLPE